MYFTDSDGYQNFLIFAPRVISLISDSNRNVTNWILTSISSKKIEPFDICLKLTMSSLANGRGKLKFNISILVKKNVFHHIGNLF